MEPRHIITNNPRPGDFGLSVLTGPAGWWVNLGQALTGDSSRFTHAFVVLDDNTVMEAMPGGARIAPLSSYDNQSVVYSRFDLTDFQRENVVISARSLEGTPYSFLDYGSLAMLHFEVRPESVRKRVADSGHMICSQLVDETYLRSGLHLFDDGRYAGDVTPGDLSYVILEDADKFSKLG